MSLFARVNGSGVGTGGGGGGGGGGLSGLTPDGVLYAATSTTAASTAVGTAGQSLISNGTGLAPTFQGAVAMAAALDSGVASAGSGGRNDVTGWGTVYFDTASGFDPVTGIYTVAVAGVYIICGILAVGYNTPASVFGLQVVQNGNYDSAAAYNIDVTGNGTTATEMPFNITVQCAVGDTLRIAVYNGTGVDQAWVGQNRYNNLCITLLR